MIIDYYRWGDGDYSIIIRGRQRMLSDWSGKPKAIRIMKKLETSDSVCLRRLLRELHGFLEENNIELKEFV
jgi:hypothetical protein